MTEAFIGFAGVILGSIIIIAKDLWETCRERHRKGSYSAIRLICILKEYALECLDVVNDDGTAFGRPAGQTESGEEYYPAQMDIPAPLEFPDDIAWRCIPEALMHRVLALPNKARSTDRYIEAANEHAFAPDYGEFFEARQHGYAHIALDAFEIIDGLCKHFKISAQSLTNLNPDWDPKVFLREKIAKFQEEKA